MLLSMINAHTINKEQKSDDNTKDIHLVDIDKSKTSQELQNLKVSELRQLVKDKNIKI